MSMSEQESKPPASPESKPPASPEQRTMPGTEGMTRESRDMAVAIAKDVISQIQTEQFPLRLVVGHAYIRGYIRSEIDRDKDLKDYIEEMQRHCCVCLLGGCMLSKARLYDAIPMSQVGTYFIDGEIIANRMNINAALMEIFSPKQMDLLECAFERYKYIGRAASERDKSLAAAFGKRYDDAGSRAVAIMSNLIDHDGVFVVEPTAEDRSNS